uniref:Extended synaptotagmin-like protein 1a n=1 Tax=Neolamprologus brichardi TaxID=32507 RepID=A0A3Q4HYT3_NEOBR
LAMPTADAEPGIGTEPLAPVSENQPQGERAVSVLWSFGKCLGALLPVYLAGYYGLSVSIVLFGLVIYMGWKHGRQEKVMRLKSAMYLLDNEREFTTQTVFRAKRDLPPWVSTDTPSVRVILCRILQQAWPFIGQYLEKLLVEIIAPAIRTSSIHLQTLSFTKVNIGDKALKVAGVKAHTENDKRQVMLDLYLSYAGDVEINVEIKKYFCKAGNLIFSLQLHGMLRVILEPLIGNIPLVGAVTMFFIRRPKLDINWTGLTNLLDIPGLNNLNPQWREMYEVIVHEVPGQELEVEVFDKDPDQDDFLGRDVASGSVHLRLEWLSLLSSADRLTEVRLQQSQTLFKVAEPPSAAILAVYLDQAYELPVRASQFDLCGIQKGNKDPSPMVQISVQDKTKESKTCYGTTSPVWEDAFTFFIKDPHKQNIDIQVKDDDRALSLGSLKIPLARLVGVPELTMDQWFQLENSGSASRIFIKIVLRVGISHTQILKHLFCAQTLMGNMNSNVHIKCPKQIPTISHRGGVKNGYSRSKDGADPYISFILLPDKKATTKRKTVTKKKDLSPEFNERFDFDLSVEESSQRRLDLSVKNSVSFISREKELIGKVIGHPALSSIYFYDLSWHGNFLPAGRDKVLTIGFSVQLYAGSLLTDVRGGRDGDRLQ